MKKLILAFVLIFFITNQYAQTPTAAKKAAPAATTLPGKKANPSTTATPNATKVVKDTGQSKKDTGKTTNTKKVIPKDTALGIPYYDAIRLSQALKKFDTNSRNSIQSILNFYFDSNSNRVKGAIYNDDSLVMNNVFLKDIVSKWYKSYLALYSYSKKDSIQMDTANAQLKRKQKPGISRSSSAFGESSSGSLLSLSGVGGMDVTNIADGIAQFLVKRGKEELDIAFFSKMKKYLSDTNHPEYATLFPATTKFLENIESYQYSELLQSLREAFQSDLNNLIVDMNQLIDLPKYDSLTHKFPAIKVALQTAKIVSSLSQSKKSLRPDTVIHLLAQIKSWENVDTNLASSWHLLDIISQSLRDTTKGDIWVSYNEFAINVLHNTNTLDIYLGLIYQQAHEITFVVKGKKSTVGGFMNGHIKTVSTISDFVENFLTLANNVETTRSDYNKKKEKGTVTNNDIYTYLNQAIDVVQYGFKVANTIKPGVAKDEYILIAEDGVDLYKNITTKTYNAAIKDVSNIIVEVDSLTTTLTQLTPAETKNLTRLEAGKKSKKSSLSDKENDTLKELELKKKEMSKYQSEVDDISKVASSVLKYGNLMASIVNAKSSDDVEKSIEAAALPAGSYSIKRNSHWNIAVNGYIGGGYDIGNPFATNPVFVAERNEYNMNWNMYAPIGFSFSLGSKCGCGSLTAFIPVIDVGSIANFRLYNANDSATLNEKVTLASIFSPGLTLIYGVPHFPLSLSAGLVYKPALIYDDSKSSLVDINGMWRFNVSLLIDIPIFNIYNKNW